MTLSLSWWFCSPMIHPCFIPYSLFPSASSCYVGLLLISCCRYTLPPSLTLFPPILVSPSCMAPHDLTCRLHACRSLSVPLSISVLLAFVRSNSQSILFLDSVPCVVSSVPTDRTRTYSTPMCIVYRHLTSLFPGT
ncbi:hypothetical protein BD311DRAFT_420095 [Dichomitus squalens]|uniref:Uncharacterized protein n=1 Tax=Dichomitus squalens TaxID=114155 RepID=A0A4Q9ML05_9APHY|nr:hypothetical protein BD311DRAFT_420095 [Dichomitus squalens]